MMNKLITRLVAISALVLTTQLFSEEVSYYIGSDDAPKQADANFVKYVTFLNKTAGDLDANNKLTLDTTTPHVCTVSGTVGGKSFTADFTVTGQNNTVVLDQDVSIGCTASGTIDTTRPGPITFTFKEFTSTPDGPVYLSGFSTFTGFRTSKKGDVEVNGDSSSILTISKGVVETKDISTYTGTEYVNESTPVYLSLKRTGGSINVKQIEFIFSDTVTPAIGLKVTQTGKKLEWSVQEELDVKEYQVFVDGKLFDVVTAIGADLYSLEVPEGKVEFFVVDNNGSKQGFQPEDGNAVSVDYNLKLGWNLIATVGEEADLSAVEAVTVGTLWAWDGDKYVEVDAPKAFTGIWAYATEQVNVSSSATKAENVMTLQPGWTLAGPANNVDLPEDVSAFSWSERYNAIVDRYNALIKGQGYWMFTGQQTDIVLDID